MHKFIFLIGVLISLCTTHLVGQTPLELSVGCEDGVEGTSTCVAVTVANLTGVDSYQGAVNFNPTVIRIDSISTLSACLPSTDPSTFSLLEADKGFIKFLWISPTALPFGCTDGDTLFSICFTFIGEPGSVTNITLNSNSGIDLDFSDGVSSIPVNVTDCSSSVLANSLTVVSKYCEASPGEQDGKIEFYAVGGAAPYNYTVVRNGTINVASGTLNDREVWMQSPLPQGNYLITVTDQTGNTASRTFNLTDNFVIDFNLSGRNPSCWNNRDGSIVISNVSGGTSPYTYSWSSRQYNVDSVTELSNGIYSVTVEDDFGCKVAKSITIFTDTLKLDIQILDSLHCEGATNGRLKIVPRNGTSDPIRKYTLFINNSRISQIDSLIATTQLRDTNSIYVQDSGFPRCSSEIYTVIIPTKYDLTSTFTVLQDVQCKGESTGRVRIVSSVPGETNFQSIGFAVPSGEPIPNGVSGPNDFFSNTLPAGSYCISVTSNNFGCRDTFCFDINEADEELLLSSTVINPTCSGFDGAITVNVTGGEDPYTYAWTPNNITGNSISGLNGGVFKVVVQDSFGCADSLELNLPMGGSLIVDAIVSQSISCSGKSDGALFVDINPPGNYNIQWADQTGNLLGDSSTLENVGEGLYYVAVSDGACMSFDSIFISAPTGMQFEGVNITNPACPGETGSIGVQVSGGFPNYNYVWKVSGSTDVISIQSVLVNILPGDYTVEVFDIEGCSIDTLLTLEEPEKIELRVSNIQGVDCFESLTGNASATASGGNTGATVFNYLWSNGATGPGVANLPAGTNWVLAGDIRCSSDTVFFEVPDKEPLSRTLEISPPACVGDCNGEVTLIPSGGTGQTYTASWAGIGQTALTAINLCAGSYDYIIRDSLDCELSGTVVLTDPDTLIVTLNTLLTREVSCRTNTGQIAVVVEGGNGDYRYTWTNNVSNAAVAQSVPPGAYTVTVTDARGCTDMVSYTLDSPERVYATIPTPDEPNCFGELTCIRVSEASGGVGGPYSFQLNQGPRFPIDTCVQVFAGTHRVVVFDETGCALDTTITISQPDPVSVSLGDDIEVNIGQDSDPLDITIISTLPIDTIGVSLLDSFFCVLDDCTRIIVRPITDQTVTVYVADINGCSDTDQLNIKVKDVREVYFPNVFNPSLATDNGNFIPSVGPGVEQIDEFIVFDRWGNKLFAKKDFLPADTKDDGWDGTFNGAVLPAGVYMYYARVTFKDDRILDYGGDITLLR